MSAAQHYIGAWKAAGVFLAAAFFVLCAIGIPSAANAATGLKIQPVKISETLSPGQQTSGTILLTNASDGPVNVEVSVQDFIPVGGADSIQFVGRAEGVTSVLDWITVGSDDVFSFAKGESRQIPYRIDVPENAEPGGHFGVIFFKATEPTDNPAETLKIGTQVGMLVLVAVPGNHLQKGNILDFTAPGFIQTGPVPFSLKFENTGTVHFEPKGSITISNMFGGKVAEVPVKGQVVLPTSIKSIDELWHVSGLLLGRYTASATIYDGEGMALTTEEVYFWAVPIWYALAFALTVAGLYFALRYLKSRVKISIVAK